MTTASFTPAVQQALREQTVELPSWAFGNSGSNRIASRACPTASSNWLRAMWTEARFEWKTPLGPAIASARRIRSTAAAGCPAW